MPHSLEVTWIILVCVHWSWLKHCFLLFEMKYNIQYRFISKCNQAFHFPWWCSTNNVASVFNVSGFLHSMLLISFLITQDVSHFFSILSRLRCTSTALCLTHEGIRLQPPMWYNTNVRGSTCVVKSDMMFTVPAVRCLHSCEEAKSSERKEDVRPLLPREAQWCTRTTVSFRILQKTSAGHAMFVSRGVCQTSSREV